MSDILMMLSIEHKQMSRVLDALERHLSVQYRHETIDPRAVSTILDYCMTHPDRSHHPKENLLYSRLCLRAPSEAEEIGDLLAEHAELSSTVRKVADLVVESSSRMSRSTAGLAELGHHFVALYRRHMALEELTFFTVAVEALTRADWDELDFRVFDGVDPLFSDRVERRFATLRADIFGT